MQEEVPEDHVLMRLGETEALRKKQTKQGFVYQNEVNSLQAELRHRMKAQKRKMSAEARERMAQNEEEYYEGRNRERSNHLRKYLKTTGVEYLEDLKKQADVRREKVANRHKRRSNKAAKVEPAEEELGSPARIGLLPMASDRQRQMGVVEQSLKHFKKQLESGGGSMAKSTISEEKRTSTRLSNPESISKELSKTVEPRK